MKKKEFGVYVNDQKDVTEGSILLPAKQVPDVVAEELKKGEKIQLVGFGTFEVSERAAREGRNPRSGEVMHIAA